MRATLSLTHRCNLACKYCYSGRPLNRDMSFATAQRVVDFVVDISQPGERIEFCFFGGEPLLCFDLIQEITSYIHKVQRETETLASVSITTNGTLLTESVLDAIGREGIALCISMDGPAHVHNRNRRYRNGRGSYADVVSNLRKAIEHLENVQVNAVYDPQTVAFLPESVSFLVQLGVSAIHLNPDICGVWTEDAYPKMQESYMQLAADYIQSYQRGQEIALSLIDSKVILYLKGGYAAQDMCGMGETEWGFAPSGNVYPCERFIGEDSNPSLCLGNVHTGIDEPRRCTVLRERGNRNQECITCHLDKYCMNWCGCTNYSMTGHTDLAGSMLCESEKAILRAARHVLISLQDNELFLDHFFKYMHEGRR